MSDVIRAVILGIIEGVTEFLPVSSTGHLLLAERFFHLGEGAFWDSFTVLIQLGAILALLSIYFGRLWALATHMFTDWAARVVNIDAPGATSANLRSLVRFRLSGLTRYSAKMMLCSASRSLRYGQRPFSWQREMSTRKS